MVILSRDKLSSMTANLSGLERPALCPSAFGPYFKGAQSGSQAGRRLCKMLARRVGILHRMSPSQESIVLPIKTISIVPHPLRIKMLAPEYKSISLKKINA
jgi:hypothetical protein